MSKDSQRQPEESIAGLRLENVQTEDRTQPPSEPTPNKLKGSNFEGIPLVANHYGSSSLFLKFDLNAKIHTGFSVLSGLNLKDLKNSY